MTPNTGEIKLKIDKMDFVEVKHFLCIKGHHQENEKTAHRMGENICQCIQLGT